MIPELISPSRYQQKPIFSPSLNRLFGKEHGKVFPGPPRFAEIPVKRTPRSAGLPRSVGKDGVIEVGEIDDVAVCRSGSRHGPSPSGSLYRGKVICRHEPVGEFGPLNHAPTPLLEILPQLCSKIVEPLLNGSLQQRMAGLFGSFICPNVIGNLTPHRAVDRRGPTVTLVHRVPGGEVGSGTLDRWIL